MRLDWRKQAIFLGGGSFSPTNIVGLKLWLDANDAATLFTDAAKITPAGDGDVVGAWADKSTNGKDATQSTTAEKATLQFNVANSLPVLRFDGTDDYYDIGDLSSLTAGEIFIVIKLDADPPPNINKTGLWDLSTGTNTVFPSNADGIIYDSFGTTATKTTVNPAQSLASQFNIYNVNSIAGEWTSRLNNSQLFTTGTNTVNFTATNTLGRSENVGILLDGDIAEVILYNAKLSDTNRGLVNTYLSNKYGVTIA